MEITQQKSGDLLVIRLNGRLDANWCGHVEKALADAVRAGEHHLQVDMSEVHYMSSLGIRILFAAYKQLKAIKGTFGVIHPSENVLSVLKMAGFTMMVAEASTPATGENEKGSSAASESAVYEIFPLKGGAPMKIAGVGDPANLRSPAREAVSKTSFGQETLALGIAGLGSEYSDCSTRFGEFLAVAGAAACQPSDGSSRADYVTAQGELVPEGFLYLGLLGTGQFSHLARFEARGETGSITLSELAANALKFAGSSTVAFAAVTETSGLVGASLRKSPAMGENNGTSFEFPKIRDWLSFTSERAYRDSTSLIVGIVSNNTNDRLAPLLRPLGQGLIGHCHAAAFPYRPLQKGRIELQEIVDTLFDGQNLQAVLHLLSDPRTINGAGESEFLRGAMWIAAIQE